MEKLDLIKERLKDALIQSGLTQKEIANKVCVSQSCIAHYIKGDFTPTIDTFAKLCAVLNVDANYILGIDDKK